MSQKSPCPTPARRGTNLPYEGSEFIGRECELAWLTEALAKGRPVEITGPCGAGKTRLSVHFGWQFLKATHAEVWFCDLSTARTGSEALTVLANIFDVPVDPDAEGGTILRAVDMAIRECGKGLLILDNYEQLASEAAELAAHIYRAAPEVHVLVTSRERVGLPGGENLALRPLPEDVAVRLFERRASALAPEFVVGEHNSAAVREIVRRMDALPLALEMAAPWIQILSAEELSNRLVTGLELRHDRTPATAHHTTMDRAIAWSWELLTDIDRGVLCLLGQFESLFDLSDAEALVGPEQCDTVLPCIRRLREHSLLLTTRVHGTGAITFQLYESVRGFVRRLPSAVEPEAAARYVNHIMTKSEALTKELHNGETPVLDQLFRLHHDLVAIFASERKLCARIALRTGTVLTEIFARTGPMERRLHYARASHEIADRTGDPALIALASLLWARAMAAAGRTGAALSLLRAASDLASGLDRIELEAEIHGLAADVSLTRCDRAEFERHSAAALALYRSKGGGESSESGRLIAEARRQGRAEPAAHLSLLERAQAAAEAEGDTALAAQVAAELGGLYAARQEPAHALTYLTVALEQFTAERRAPERVRTLNHMAGRLIELGRLDEAETRAGEALATASVLGFRLDEAASLGRLATVALRRNDFRDGLRRLERAAQLLANSGAHRRQARVAMLLVTTHLAEGRQRQALKVTLAGLDIAHESCEPQVICHFQVLLGCIYLGLGDTQRANVCFELTRRCLTHKGTEETASAIATLDAFQTLSDQRHRGAAGDLGPVTEALRALGAESTMAARACRALAYALAIECPTEGPVEESVLEVAPNGDWFQLGSNPRVDLRRRGAVRRILVGFVAQLASKTPKPLTLNELFEIGWPDEQVIPHAAANRVYAALSSLRKVGLQDILLTRANGWLLDPTLKVAQRSLSRTG